MKKCFKCQADKPLDDFYRHKMMADGHLNKCKVCARSDVDKYRSENIDKIRAFDRERGLSENRLRLNRARYEKNKHDPAFKERQRAKGKRDRLDNPLQRAARVIVGHAIRDRRLLRQPCEICGSEERIEAHHDDYTQPLQVRWLCRLHHIEHHKAEREIKRRGQSKLR